MTDKFEELSFVKLKYNKPEDHNNFEIGQLFRVIAVDRGCSRPQGALYLCIEGSDNYGDHKALDKFIADTIDIVSFKSEPADFSISVYGVFIDWDRTMRSKAELEKLFVTEKSAISYIESLKKKYPGWKTTNDVCYIKRLEVLDKTEI